MQSAPTNRQTGRARTLAVQDLRRISLVLVVALTLFASVIAAHAPAAQAKLVEESSGPALTPTRTAPAPAASKVKSKPAKKSKKSKKGSKNKGWKKKPPGHGSGYGHQDATEPPDLKIVKSGPTTFVRMDEAFAYSISVTNLGSTTATGVTVTDKMPASVASFVVATTDRGSCDFVAGLLTCHLGSLDPGAIATISFTIKPKVCRMVWNTARVSSEETDKNPANNESTVETLVICDPDLEVTKTDGTDPVPADQALTYTITLTNKGGAPATGVILKDVLGSGEFVSAHPSQGSCGATGTRGRDITCHLGDLAPGAQATVLIKIDLTRCGVITNSATVAAAEAESNIANNTATEETTVVEPCPIDPDLSIQMTQPEAPAIIGSPHAYTLAIPNAGPEASTGSFLVNQLDSSVTFVSATSDNGSCLHISGLVYCEFGPMAVSAVTTVTITVTPLLEGTIFNAASVGGNELDDVPDNDEAVVETEVIASAGDDPTAPDSPAPPAPITMTLSPTDDTFVKKTLSNRNFGSLETLEVDADPLKPVLFKFDLSSVPGDVTSARLRLFNTDGSPHGGDVFAADGNNWTEATATYRVRPRWVGSAAASLGLVQPDNWYEIDVTSLVTSTEQLTLFLVSTSSDEAHYSSKEGANPPQLVLTTAGT